MKLKRCRIMTIVLSIADSKKLNYWYSAEQRVVSDWKCNNSSIWLNVTFLASIEYLSLLLHMSITQSNQCGSTSIHTDPLCLSNRLSLTQCSAFPHVHISQLRPPANKCITRLATETQLKINTHRSAKSFCEVCRCRCATKGGLPKGHACTNAWFRYCCLCLTLCFPQCTVC